MIALLVWVLVLLLVLGFIIWVVQQIPLPPPFGTIAIGLVGLIFILILVSMLLGEIPLHPVLLR